MAVDPLKDLTRAVLHLDRARTVDPKNEDRPFVPPSPPRLSLVGVGVVLSPWPDHPVGHGELGEVGANDRLPLAEQGGGCESAAMRCPVECARGESADRPRRPSASGSSLAAVHELSSQSWRDRGLHLLHPARAYTMTKKDARPEFRSCRDKLPKDEAGTWAISQWGSLPGTIASGAICPGGPRPAKRPILTVSGSAKSCCNRPR